MSLHKSFAVGTSVQTTLAFVQNHLNKNCRPTERRKHIVICEGKTLISICPWRLATRFTAQRAEWGRWEGLVANIVSNYKCKGRGQSGQT